MLRNVSGADRLFLAALSASLVGCADRPVAPDGAVGQPPLLSTPLATSIQCDADNGGLTLPPGFCAVVVARDIGRARHIAVRPNGDIYVALNNNPGTTTGGAVAALRDTDGDGRADVIQRFGPTGGNGVAWGEGQLYFAPDDRVLRYTFVGNELVPTGGEDVIVSGLPDTDDHPRKTVVLDGRSGMFVNIASGSNSCQVVDRTDFSPGIDPCPELPVRAGVWHFSATTLNQTQSSGTRFATELRNMTALAINPADGKLYGAQNGRDQLFDNWSNLFDARDDALLPAEELFLIEQGKEYGWPYCYYDGVRNKKVLAPEYGGDGRIEGRCAGKALPIADYPAHWAPLGMTFYSGTQFPKRYEGGLFIAWHGSRFDPRLQPAGPGFIVTFTPWRNGRPAGEFETFADGFAAGNPTPTGAAHRPVGVALAPDGSLYISDDRAGWIWRVFYVGP
jgi:glucose/arabinose dehydrogenase